MRHILPTLAVVLLAMPAAAQWAAGVPTAKPFVEYDQTFTYTYSTEGYSSTNQDVTECQRPTVTISSTNAAAEILDCPAADSDATECVSKIHLPNPRGYEPGGGPFQIHVFQKGFAMVRVTDATPTGTVTLACHDTFGYHYNGTSWVPTPVLDDTYDFPLELPATSDAVYVKVTGGDLTVTSLDCVATGGTTPNVTVAVSECDSNASSCVASGFSANVTALVTNTQDATGTDDRFDEGDWLKFGVTAVTTSPDWLHCTVSVVKEQ